MSRRAQSRNVVRDERYKLIYYPVGNLFQLFDLSADPHELTDLSGEAAHAETLSRMQDVLKGELHGSDREWLDGNTFAGRPDKTYRWQADRGMHFQRGEGWPR